MNDQQFDDLKQFIDSRISRSERLMEGNFRSELDARISQSERLMKNEFRSELRRLEQKVDDGFAGISDAIEQINQRADDRDKEVDQRFTKLEQQAA